MQMEIGREFALGIPPDGEVTDMQSTLFISKRCGAMACGWRRLETKEEGGGESEAATLVGQLKRGPVPLMRW